MPMPPLEELSCARGAPMGRSNRDELEDDVGRVFLQRVPFVDGCYDRGGAYWGAPANLWRAYAQEEATKDAPHNPHRFHQVRQGDILVFEQFVRANSREQAKALLLEDFPTISFYR